MNISHFSQHTTSFVMIVLLFFFTFSLSAQNTIDETTIKTIIESETLAFASADLETWSTYFVHEPYLRWRVSSTMFFDGWDALYQGAKSFLESKPGRSAANELHQIIRKDWNIHLIGDMAWVKYVQVIEGEQGTTQQFRVLERKDGAWKIALLIAVH